MVGELQVALAGQTAVVKFFGGEILVCFDSYSSAISLLSQPLPNLSLAGRMLKFTDISLLTQLGPRRRFELFPNPNILVRWLSPKVRELIEG
jgi:hypothetical protein